MLCLPTEVQLDVLKCLNFNQLFDIKQTNLYLLNLINKFEGELARQEFIQIALVDHHMLVGLHPSEFIEPESGIFEFTLLDQLKNKAAIDKSIPLFLHYFEPNRECICIAIVNEKCHSVLKLPIIPKNIKEMIIVRCWLEKLFNCAFGYASFYKNIFNPEMINILFDDDKTIPLQFNIKRVILCSNYTVTKIFESALKFSLNHLSISESLSINLDATSEQYTDILFNILINEGNKFPKISLNFQTTSLYNLIVKYVTTSKDCSKIVPFIHFDRISAINFKLNERAEKIEIDQSNGNNSTKYQIVNIHNSKARFEFYNREGYDGSFYIQIRKIKV